MSLKNNLFCIKKWYFNGCFLCRNENFLGFISVLHNNDYLRRVILLVSGRPRWPEMHPEPSEMSEIELFAKTVWNISYFRKKLHLRCLIEL